MATRTNLATNPLPASDTGWTVSSGNTLTFIADDGGQPALEAADPVGGASLYVDPTDHTNPEVGQWVAFGVDVKGLDEDTAAAMALRVMGYGGTEVDNDAVQSRPVTTTGYTRISVAAQVTVRDPAGYLRTLIWPFPSPASPNAFRFRKVVVAVADTETAALSAVETYFDGNTPSTGLAENAWSGTANNSTSVQNYVSIVADELNTTPPQVGVTVSVIDPENPTEVSIEVSWDEGRTWFPLRGSTGAVITAASFFRDLVPPLNTEVVYRIVTPEAHLEAEPITLESDVAWVHDPLNPRGSVPIYLGASAPEGKVWLAHGSLTEGTRNQSVDIAFPQGSAYAIASTGNRTALAEVPIMLAYEVEYGDDGLVELLSNGGQVVFTGLPDNMLDPTAYVVTAEVALKHEGASPDIVATHELRVTQVRPLAAAIAVPYLTYEAVMFLVAEALGPGATYQDVMDTVGDISYIDFTKDPEGVLGL